MRIELTTEDRDFIKEQAVARREANLKGKNFASNNGSVTFRIEEEMWGIAGEFAVARALGLDPYKVTYVYEQDEFRGIKNNIRDVGAYEIKAWDDIPNKVSIIVPAKNLTAHADIPHIGCRVGKEFDYVVLVGYVYPADYSKHGLEPVSFRSLAYFFKPHTYRPITDLIKEGLK
jgi:hypothetical protein